MTTEILSPFSQTSRRSVTSSNKALLTGRWVAIDANGQAAYPGSAGDVNGLNLLLEGDSIHIGDPTEFGGSTPFASTNEEKLPSVQAVGAVALAYGVFRYRTGPEGCDPTATFAIGAAVSVDADGRIVTTGAVKVAIVEAVTTDAGSKVTELVLRTLGN